MTSIMWVSFLLLAIFGCVVQAFVTVPRLSITPSVVNGISPRTQVLLMACRRNNKTEKRKRNREYARKFQTKGLDSRKTIVIEQKRGIVAKSEEKFQAQVFKMTTDEDMPAYSGFEFTS